MKKKRRIKKKVIVLIILIFILIGMVTATIFYTKSHKPSTEPTPEVKVVDKIEGYDYSLENNKTDLYKDLFDKLVDVLKQDPVNEEEYAKIISQMAVIDFYNLDNKVSKNDVGGTQFIKSDNVENFIYEASETVYKYVEQNLDGKRKQELPIVTKSEIVSIKQKKYTYKKIVDDKAYVVKVKLEYKKDLGYPTQVTVKLLHTDKKLEIYYMK